MGQSSFDVVSEGILFSYVVSVNMLVTIYAFEIISVASDAVGSLLGIPGHVCHRNLSCLGDLRVRERLHLRFIVPFGHLSCFRHDSIETDSSSAELLA